MSYSFTSTDTIAFTITHARHMAAKVATDLKRIQRLYGSPTDEEIADYEAEVVELLKCGYLGTVTYGFRRDGKWTEPTVQYRARDLAGSAAANDDDPGRVRAGANIDGATFWSYMTYSAAWDQLSSAQRDACRARLPIKRSGAPEPSVNGYLTSDRTYSAGGRALDRASVRNY